MSLGSPAGRGRRSGGLGTDPGGCRTSRAQRAPATRQGRKRVVVVGEANSGKTALVNSIVGAEVLKPSFISPTLHQTVVRYATSASLWAETSDGRRMQLAWGSAEDRVAGDIYRLHVGVPLARLAGMTVIDTPGLEPSAEENTARICRNADLVIWCTPAMQAWKASEKQAWLALPERVHSRSVLAVTFADEIESQSDMARLMARLREDAGPYFVSVVIAAECAQLLSA